MLRFNHEAKREKKVLSVLGMTEASGATRLALAIANYCASAQRRKTAYGEIADETKLGAILEKARCIGAQPVGFEDSFLRYYPALGKEEIKILMDQNWERLILDQTMDDKTGIAIGSGAQHILMIDPTPWRYHQIQLGMRNLMENKQLYRLLMGNAYTYIEEKRWIDRFSEEFGINLHKIPWIRDPYCLRREDRKTIEQVMMQCGKGMM